MFPTTDQLLPDVSFIISAILRDVPVEYDRNSVTSEEMDIGPYSSNMGGDNGSFCSDHDRSNDDTKEEFEDTLCRLAVSCIQNLFQEFTDISAPSLCRVELMEYRDACLSWITLLRDTPQPIGILSPPITTTSMSATFVVTETIPVDVHGSIDRYFGPERDEEDFVEFLE